MRDREKNPLDHRDRDSKRLRAIQRRLDVINEALLSITVSHPALGIIRPGDPIRFGASRGYPARPTLHRVFTNDLDHHGRFYGGFWQGMPKQERARLMINGEAVGEHDYRQHHIRLAYALAGVPIPDGDLYDLQTNRWKRSLVKLATNTMLNACDRRSALGAIVTEAIKHDILRPPCQHLRPTSALLDLIERRHAAVHRCVLLRRRAVPHARRQRHGGAHHADPSEGRIHRPAGARQLPDLGPANGPVGGGHGA